MRATFLGHHGWLLDEDQTVVWVDPLLRSRFGWHPASERVVHPPRTVDPGRAPSAIVLSRDHEESVDWPSLERAPAGTPVYLASRVSAVLLRRLAALGLAPRPLCPGEPVCHQALTIETDGGDGLERPTFFVRGRSGDGMLFGAPESEPAALARGLAASARRFTWHCGYSSFQTRAQESWFSQGRLERVELLAALLERISRVSAQLGTPARLHLCGSGWAFDGDRAWLNPHGFIFDGAELAAAVGGVVPFPAGVPEPGASFEVSSGAEVAGRSVAIACETTAIVRGGQPQPRWRARSRPATGRTDLCAGDGARLAAALAQLAAGLYGRPLFRALYSLDRAGGCAARAPTFALLLLAGSGSEAFVLVYDPPARRFVASASRDPVRDHLAVFECWATDLIDVLTLALPLSAIAQGRCRSYNSDPARFRFDLISELESHLHTLRCRA